MVVGRVERVTRLRVEVLTRFSGTRWHACPSAEVAKTTWDVHFTKGGGFQRELNEWEGFPLLHPASPTSAHANDTLSTTALSSQRPRFYGENAAKIRYKPGPGRCGTSILDLGPPRTGGCAWDLRCHMETLDFPRIPPLELWDPTRKRCRDFT
eukprot:gene16188-biopygen20255